jgi:ABC-2 type transport system permease protein
MLKYVSLVAQREFGENAKTKGFWIGILIFPIMLIAGMKIPAMLEQQVPTRYFTVVDQSQHYEKAIAAAIEADHARRVGESRLQWQQKAISAGESTVGTLKQNLEREVGTEVAGKILARFQQMAIEALVSGPESLDFGKFNKIEGVTEADFRKAASAVAAWSAKAFEAGKSKIAPFEEPRRKFALVAPPADTRPEALVGAPPAAPGANATAENEGIASFRPYLTGSKTITVDGKQEKLFALVVIPADAASIGPGEEYKKVEYWCSNLTDADLSKEIRVAMEKEARGQMFSQKGMTPESVEQIQRTRFDFAGKDPKKEAGKEGVSFEDKVRQWAPVGAVYLLWVAIFSVAQMLLNNTTEEKQSRVIEVLLSSVTPTELMFGKLLGIAAVGLTMIGSWILSFIAIIKLGAGPGNELADALMKVMYTPELLIAFASYFLLGYLLYAGVFLAVGAVVNTLKEAQNLMGPVMLVMSIPLFTMIFIAKEPNGVLARVLSWIPLYTPFVMMNRAAAAPPLFDVAGTLALLLLSVIASIWLSGRIFRIGVLRTGQPPKLLELFHWIRTQH